MSAQPLLAGQRAPASLAVAVAAVASVALLAIVSGVAGPSALLARQPQMLYGEYERIWAIRSGTWCWCHSAYLRRCALLSTRAEPAHEMQVVITGAA